VTISPAQIEQFANGFQGRVLGPIDAGYDDARKLWNGMIDRRPALIARCTGAADAAAAVTFARANGLEVAVRGGGHNAAGNAVCDGGLMIDLSAMNAVQGDPVTRTARAQGGATWADLDRATQEHGLATTGGAVSSTGIAGLTLGGGLGWLMRSYGLTCDNLLSAEVVTAAGEIVTASASENADLFWGLRGGGGNFGIVTTFEYQLHPVGLVLGGMLGYPAEMAGEVLRRYRDFARTAPEALTLFAGLMTSPEGLKLLGILVCYNGPIDEGERALQPFRDACPPLMEQLGPMPYTVLQSLQDAIFPHGLNVYWRSHFLDDLGDATISTIVEHFSRVTSPLSVVLIEQLGGAVRRVGVDETAFAGREADFNVAIIGRWGDPTDADAHIAWTRQFHEALRPHARGVYVNYLGEEGADRVRAAYTPAQYARLVALKTRYDPTNLFHLNQNIAPRQ
jgi:FAD/FMN-containing dehydrogenase